jgi:sensor c-di-GMP phosphodiesterase-like protein
MTSRKKRFLFSSAAIIASALAGIFAGYLLGIAITVRVAEIRLNEYANRIAGDWEASSSELRTALVAVGASQLHPCSSAEIGYFHALIFESEFLRDAGRMHGDGNIDCSADLGKLARPLGESKADFTQQDGTKIYQSLSPYRSNGLQVITLQLNDAFVVFTPITRMHVEPYPMHYTLTVTDAPTLNSRSLLGEPTRNSLPIFTHEGQFRQRDTLFSTRCSIRFFSCATAYTSIPEMLQDNHAKFAGCIALGGLSGALFGLVLCMLYRRNKSVEQQLRRAIRKDKLRVFYQPEVDLRSERIVGAEALVRWTDEDGVVVGPDVFVRIAEQRGFVGEITRLVLRHALRDFGETLRKNSDFRLSINVAAADLTDPEFLPLLDRSLGSMEVPPRALAIEITESSTARRETAIETIHSLRRRGHSVHIDDFGTGYSSLSYLHELSVDAIKIDKTFTQAIGTESVVVTILPQILSMAEALGLEVIVEGIETTVQAEYFTAFAQPILAQGWLFGRPVPADSFLRLLASDEKKSLQSAPATLELDLAVEKLP